MMKQLNLISYYDEHMKQIDMKDLITVRLSFPSTPFTNFWGGGSDGILPIHYGADTKQRPVIATILTEAHDFYDYALLKSKLFVLLGHNKSFYVVDKRQAGKRFKVILDTNYSFTRISPKDGEVEVPFLTEELPYAESIGTTLSPRDFVSDLWQVGQGLKAEDLSYVHQSNSFRIYNAGNVTVDPVEMPLLIKYQGASENLSITNKTTGETWEHYGSSGANDEISLDGAQILKNDLNMLRDTNRKLITLVPGWNEFELSGTSDSFIILFDFRFYYL